MLFLRVAIEQVPQLLIPQFLPHLAQRLLLPAQFLGVGRLLGGAHLVERCLHPLDCLPGLLRDFAGGRLGLQFRLAGRRLLAGSGQLLVLFLDRRGCFDLSKRVELVQEQKHHQSQATQPRQLRQRCQEVKGNHLHRCDSRGPFFGGSRHQWLKLSQRLVEQGDCQEQVFRSAMQIDRPRRLDRRLPSVQHHGQQQAHRRHNRQGPEIEEFRPEAGQSTQNQQADPCRESPHRQAVKPAPNRQQIKPQCDPLQQLHRRGQGHERLPQKCRRKPQADADSAPLVPPCYPPKARGDNKNRQQAEPG